MLIAFLIILALIAGIVTLMATNSKETGGKATDTTTEQNESRDDTQDDGEDAGANDNEEAGSGLQVIGPEEVVHDNSSNASGDWDNTPDSEKQNGNTSVNDNTNKADNQNQNNNPSVSDQENTKELEKGGDILKDEIDWGDVY